MTPKNYVRLVRMRQDVWPGHDMEMGQMQERYTLQFNPLISLDGNVIDAVIRCQIDQIEKRMPVAVDIPSLAGGPAPKPCVLDARLCYDIRCWNTRYVPCRSVERESNPGGH